MVVVLEPPAERRDGGELLMSGCVCHGSAACLDLNMLGQWLLLKEEAMLGQLRGGTAVDSFFSSLAHDDALVKQQRQLGILYYYHYFIIYYCY